MERKRKKTFTEQALSDEKLISSAYQDGMSALLETHPQFKQNETYLTKHIDKRKLNKKIEELSEASLKYPPTDLEKRKKYIRENLASYVASGDILDDKAKNVLLKGGLEEKAESGLFKGFFARRKLKGEKYLDNTIEAFQDLYSLFKTGDYAERMPELAQAVQTVYDTGFFHPAIDILKSYGLINNKKYNLLKKSIRKTTKENAEFAITGIESYITQQATAAILGIIGILMVFTSANMTGGVIGALGGNTIKILGAILFLIALFLFLNILRKKKKSKTFKNR